MKDYPGEHPPRYIVGTTALLGVGVTLTAPAYFLQFEPEWNERDEKQARKRISRISQTRETHTYAFHTVNGKVEDMIFDRHRRRAYMLDLSLNMDSYQAEFLPLYMLEDEDEPPDQSSVDDATKDGNTTGGQKVQANRG